MPQFRLSRTFWCLAIAIAPLAAACASRGEVAVLPPRPFPAPAGETPPTRIEAPLPNPPIGTPASIDRQRPLSDLLAAALDLRGTPYRNGGSDPSGFDCSGFTQFVFATQGMRLPREVRDQYRVGDRITRADIQPGDLLFFSTTAPGASHVAIVLGPDDFIHAPSSRGVVRIEHLSTDYWSKRFVGARRLPLETAN